MRIDMMRLLLLTASILANFVDFAGQALIAEELRYIAAKTDSLAERCACPVDVGDRAQLFVDRLLVREAAGISFTQHQGRKHPDNPLLKADRPWEGWRLEIFGNVI